MRGLVKPRVTKTGAIRAKVFERAKGHCESCGRRLQDDGEEGLYFGDPRGELDHAFGRKHVAEAVENCWAICARPCHLAKTNNEPSALFWSRKFLLHCIEHGYWPEAERALVRIQVLAAKSALSAGLR